ncbi:uncharacterized protein LOC132721554 [Ruditapes philippinarum]|uniref:uncharacterized protein LOC132721554 n=1 Tax=Ruditapes philippinarum TaxID=129788 RepID=UPI00295A8A3A|nr:uncharacterized protein LOC132721554 [Ruditapes philippinarum]
MPRKKTWKRAKARRAVLGCENQGQAESIVTTSSQCFVIASSQSSIFATTQSQVMVPAQNPAVSIAQSPIMASAQSPVIASAKSPVIVSAQSPVIASAKSPVIVSAQAQILPSIIHESESTTFSVTDLKHSIFDIKSVMSQQNDTFNSEQCHTILFDGNENTKPENTGTFEFDHSISETVRSVNDNALLYKAYPVKSFKRDSWNLTGKCEDTLVPFTCRSFILGSYHQGDSRYSVFSRGSQCTINSLCALIYAKFSDFSTKVILDEVLDVGDKLYKDVLYNLKQLGKFKHRLLCFDEIPDQVFVLSRFVHVEKVNVISGVAVQQFGNSSLPSLYQSLYTALVNVQHVLVMIGAICSAVFVKDDMFWFFDSHAHGKFGLSCPAGKSLLISFSTLDDLLSFMYAMYESMRIDLTSQYEILPLKFTVLDNRDTNNLNLITKYFEDQHKKNLCKMEDQTCYIGHDNSSSNQGRCTGVKNRKQERREYFRKYRQFRRKDTEFKRKEKEMQTASKRKARVSKDYLKIEREFKQDKRAIAEFKRKEKEIQNNSKRKARSDAIYKKKEREFKQDKRAIAEFKRKEKEIQNNSKRKARSDAIYKKKEREFKQDKRAIAEFKRKEKEIQNVSKRKARSDAIYKKKEREFKQDKRAIAEFKRKENEIQYALKRKARSDAIYKKKERDFKQNERKDVEFRILEKEKQKMSKRNVRMNPYVSEIERVRKQISRSNVRNKNRELLNDKTRKAVKRKDPDFQQNENFAAKRKKHGNDIDNCISVFHESVKLGPQFICTCCLQTWFRQSVCNVKFIKGDIDLQFLTGTLSVDGLEWICLTCKTGLLNKKVPKLSVRNGMSWPKRPNELNLYPLEERLISLRIPFMQIRELPRGRQYSVKGNVVNVPVDIQPVVNELPRPFDENITVAVKLKKKLSYKSCVFSENVRPFHVLVALHWLKRNSDLYKHSAVTIDEEWATRVTKDCEETVQNFLSFDTTRPENTTTAEQNFTPTCNAEAVTECLETNTYDSDAEENAQENVGNIDTLLDNADIENRNTTFTFAPGEGQRPLSIYQDTDSEFLCFPSIFCGQRRLDNAGRLIPVNYSDIAKWELRSSDRRAANSVPNIFFKMKKIQMKQLNDKVNLAVRRCQFEGGKLTAGQAKDSDYMEQMVKKNEGYYLFKQLRNSPAYLETRKKDVFAMIRQLGLPTWFMSLSSADTRWIDLLKVLSKLNNIEYSEEQISNMTWENKIKLIQKDPVTCSRYFDQRVQQFIKIILKSSHNFLGHMSDYFFRVEFQQRGSPHIHMLIWIEDSPKYNSSSNEDIIAFVDKYLKCCSDEPHLQDLIQLQIHKHSRTCHKKEDKICRFGFPLPPLRETMVLEPLESDVDKYKKMYEKIQKKMNNEKDGLHMSYEQFLADFAEMSEEDYIKCIRSSLKASKVFLKREPKDIRVNLYNKAILRAWEANIDIQFVLDPYACAMYIVSYISKSQRGMSTLLHAAAKEAKNGNLDIKRQVRHIGNVFSNSVEVSAQEAVYLVLQMPLTRSTRDVVFINTSQPNQRIQLLKQKDALEELPESSTDIVADNAIKRYSRRPKCLENWCLADYMSQLDVVYPDDYEMLTNDKNSNEDDDNIVAQEVFNDTVLIMKNGIKIRKRQNQKVIRYVRFNPKSDEHNHFREKLLLFLPWRDETTDLIANYETYKQHYEARKHEIDIKCKVYEHHVEELQVAQEAAEKDYNTFDEIAPGTQQVEAETAAEESVESDTFVYFNPDRAVEHRNYDIGIELGSCCASVTVDLNQNVLSDEQYRQLLRCLNSKQRHFFNHVIHWIKTKDKPVYAFLTGGAGVGKSVVIKALYQTLYRYLNLSEGENADEKRILLCAYTGKAAYNINGSTISTAFHQKFKQKQQTLNCDNLNTFRSKYRNLSVVIIDEISMVSNSLLMFIDQRLQELTGTRTPFGGKSIIAVGDLYQLKPVAGSWIFQDLTSDAAALACNLWQDYFTMFELTEIMRQKDDSEFAELLNRLRHNKLTDNDKKQIQQCHIDQNSVTYPHNAPHIFAENSFMHAFNEKIINNINSQKVEIPCHDSIVGVNISENIQNEILQRIPTDTNTTMGLQYKVTVVIGMIYDLTVNIDTEDGLTNGASCVVKHIEYKQTETNRPSIIWVKFDDARIGSERRKKYHARGFYNDCINGSWTPIFDIERTFPYRQKTINRIQFPLQPSAGRTVHRAQGTTLDQVVIDLSQRKVRKIPHIHYVALSRVRSIKNLSILNLNEQAISLDERVVEEMQRLSSEAKLQLCYIPLDTVNSDEHFKIVYNNCRSLHKHFEDVSVDQNILSAHVIGFSETRLVQRDENSDYSINGFQLFRNDQNQMTQRFRPPHGLALYVKDDVIVSKFQCYSTKDLEWISIHADYMDKQMQIVMVYKSPGRPLHKLISNLEKELFPHIDFGKSLLIMGDFNIDISVNDINLEHFMAETFLCEQKIREPTTDLGSTLDLVFTNCNGNFGTIETYWSDHKLIYFYI